MVLLSLLSACDEQADDSAKVPDMPRFSDARLSQGRSVWMSTCRNCHLLGVSNAPAVTDHEAWLPRIAKGKQALYDSAVTGVKGVQDEVRMPPRGGNPRLSDEQVKKAVDYMIASVEHLKNAAP
jgi:cytochrome c5